jgi:hypothetical protein
MAATSPPFIPCQPLYLRPAHFDLPKVDLLTSQQQTKQFNALPKQTNIEGVATAKG